MPADGVVERPEGPVGGSNNTSWLPPVSAGSGHAAADAVDHGRAARPGDVDRRDDDNTRRGASGVTIAVRDRPA